MALLAVTLLLILIRLALSAVRYDQAQTGDYNVHLDLKNIEVLAFLDGSALGLNDYEYDYGEYTLKPPSNTSVAGTGFNPEASNSTEAVSLSGTNSTESSAPSNSSVPLGEPAATNETGVKEDTTKEPTSTSTNKPARRCGAGFYRDDAGRCRRLRRPINKLSGLLQQAKNRISGK